MSFVIIFPIGNISLPSTLASASPPTQPGDAGTSTHMSGPACKRRQSIHPGKKMIFCSCCGKQVHESAPTCPHCGGVQHRLPQAAAKAEGPVWLAIVALVAGIMCALALLDDEPMDADTLCGLFIFSLIGIVCGVISIKNYVAGKKMAIAAVVLSSISSLAVIGMLAT